MAVQTVIAVFFIGTSLAAVELAFTHVEFKQDLSDLVGCVRVDEPAVDAVLDLQRDAFDTHPLISPCCSLADYCLAPWLLTSCLGSDHRDPFQHGLADLDLEPFPRAQLQGNRSALHQRAEQGIRRRSSDDRDVFGDEFVFFGIDDLAGAREEGPPISRPRRLDVTSSEDPPDAAPRKSSCHRDHR
jgi:hypothetical protein